MQWFMKCSRSTRFAVGAMALLTAAGLATVVGCGSDSNSSTVAGLPNGKATLAQVARGQYLVTSLSCADCHNRGKDDTSDPNWLAGFIGAAGAQGTGSFTIGPFQTYAANLTPDMNTGIGMHTDRQIYNALKFGLDPMQTPDAVITSTTPGVGNFPQTPYYLPPPMPWPSFRHLSDDDLWAIVAYVKHGIKPVSNTVPTSQGPPDHWASSYTPDKIGPVTIPAYPSGNEQFSP